MMETTHAKQLTRDVFERAFGNGDLSVIDDALDPNAVDRHAFGPDEPDMAAHLKGAVQMFRDAFPDLSVTVGHLVQEGNVVAVRVEMSGHHTGTPIFGIAASGAAVEIEQFHVIEVDDEGRGLRHWANVGIEQMMAQLAPNGRPGHADHMSRAGSTLLS
jgi:predicted ester cyclase